MNCFNWKSLAFSLVILLTAGCSTVPEQQDVAEVSEPQVIEGGVEVSDPLEGFNRTMWTFNHEYLDPYVLRPVSLGYVNYTPHVVRTGIANFFSNLDEPSSFINDLLMGNGEEAVAHFNRFWMNSTFGLFGLWDFAGVAGINKQDNRSFSDVVGHYGVGNGPYLMLPGYGPMTTRQVTNTVDSMYFPLSYISFWTSVGKFAFEGMESRAAVVSQEPMLDASPDSYLFVRDAFIQRRNFKAQVETESFDAESEAFLDEYLEEEFD